MNKRQLNKNKVRTIILFSLIFLLANFVVASYAITHSTNNDTFQATVDSCAVTYTSTTITAKVKVRYTKDGTTLGSTTKTIKVV